MGQGMLEGWILKTNATGPLVNKVLFHRRWGRLEERGLLTLASAPGTPPSKRLNLCEGEVTELQKRDWLSGRSVVAVSCREANTGHKLCVRLSFESDEDKSRWVSALEEAVHNVPVWKGPIRLLSQHDDEYNLQLTV